MKAIIDGDEVAYKAAFAAARSWYAVFNPSGFLLAAFSTEEEANRWKDEQDKVVVMNNIDSDKVAYNYAETIIADVCSILCTSDIVLCFSGEQNFRFDLATIQPYKGNRGEPPRYVSLIKEHLRKYYDSVTVNQLEADDLLAILYNMNLDSVIISQDKDLLQVPGMHLNMGTSAHKKYGETVFEITQEEGYRNFYHQMLAGDPTDTIPGLYRITGCKNTAKLNSLLDSASCPVELYNIVRGIYSDCLGNMDKNKGDIDCILWEIGNLLYMRRSFEDEGWEIPL